MLWLVVKLSLAAIPMADNIFNIDSQEMVIAFVMRQIPKLERLQSKFHSLQTEV